MNLAIEFKDGGAGAKITVDCPHVENGACSECLEPMFLELVRGRSAVRCLEKVEELLRANASDMVRAADWVKRTREAKWEMGEPTPDQEGRK